MPTQTQTSKDAKTESAEQPPLTSKDHLILELSTHAEEIHYITQRVAERWGKDVSFEGFASWNQIAFESEVGKQKADNNLGLFYFILKDLSIKINQPEDAKLKQDFKGKNLDQIVARCETLNRPILKASNSSKGTKEVVAINFSLVLTFPEFHKRGFGEILIEEVYQFWRDALSCSEPDENIAILFSGAGDYYSRNGFKSNPVPIHDILPTIREESKSDNTDQEEETMPLTYLKFNSYGELISSFAQDLQITLQKEAQTSTKELYALKPTIETFNLIHEREFLHASASFPSDYRETVNVGAMLDEKNFVIWSHNFPHKRIDVLTIQYESPPNLNKLLKISLKEVEKFEFINCELWDSSIKSTEDREFLANYHGKRMTWYKKNTVIPYSRLLDDTNKGKDEFDWIHVEPWGFY